MLNMLRRTRHDDRAPRTIPTRPLVLLAIDDEPTRHSYAYVLSANGFDTLTTDAATEQAIRCDVIVADVSGDSDDRDRWTRVRTLRTDCDTQQIPIVALTADARDETRDLARREGCAAVCVKTCPPRIVVAGLHAVLDRAALADHRTA
jgi:DNA-binding response OmpR family regulator